MHTPQVLLAIEHRKWIFQPLRVMGKHASHSLQRASNALQPFESAFASHACHPRDRQQATGARGRA